MTSTASGHTSASACRRTSGPSPPSLTWTSYPSLTAVSDCIVTARTNPWAFTSEMEPVCAWPRTGSRKSPASSYLGWCLEGWRRAPGCWRSTMRCWRSTALKWLGSPWIRSRIWWSPTVTTWLWPSSRWTSTIMWSAAVESLGVQASRLTAADRLVTRVCQWPLWVWFPLERMVTKTIWRATRRLILSSRAASSGRLRGPTLPWRPVRLERSNRRQQPLQARRHRRARPRVLHRWSPPPPSTPSRASTEGPTTTITSTTTTAAASATSSTETWPFSRTRTSSPSTVITKYSLRITAATQRSATATAACTKSSAPWKRTHDTASHCPGGGWRRTAPSSPYNTYKHTHRQNPPNCSETWTGTPGRIYIWALVCFVRY